MAAATALKFSRAGKKTLIISTDPAHSLSDSFQLKIGGDPKELEKNLYGVEIDPAMALEEYKDRFTPQMEKMDFLKGMGLDDTFDLIGMSPGVDEIAAFDKFMQYMNSKDYDIVIFDTAPTGHALRFLSLPELLDSWVRKMIKLRMRFSGVINIFKKMLPFGEAEEQNMDTEYLEKMKERIKQARIILTDPKKTHFFLVTIPEQMSFFETERTVKTLKSNKIPISGIIINQILPKNHCDFCEARRDMQDRNIKKMRGSFSGMDLKEIALFKTEITGFKDLEKLGKNLAV